MDDDFLGSSTPACRHAEGTISSSSVLDVWRMASEDSDQLVPGFSVVHRLRDAGDLDETVTRQVTTSSHHVHTADELREVVSLRRPQRILLEERDDPFDEVDPSGHGVLTQRFLVVVVTTVRAEPPDAEELLELLEATATSLSLGHDKRMAHLIAGCVALRPRAAWLPHEADGEASFSVHKANHPTTELDQPFLLIVRTRHVVTMVNARSDVTPLVRDTRSSQHIARCTHPRCRGGGQRSSERDGVNVSLGLPFTLGRL